MDLLGDLDDAVLVVDPNGLIVEANRVALRQANGHPDGLVGAHLWDLVPAGRVGQRKFVLADVLATGRSARFVDRVGDRWTEVVVRPLPGADAPAERVVVVHRDVQARVTAEEELKRLRLRVLTIQEEERRAISQDLHDELGQGMTALLLQLKALAEEEAVPADMRRRLRDATLQVEALTKSMRQIFYRLRPPPLHSTPLPEALGDYCASFSQATRLRIDFHADEGLPPVEGSPATALYRLLQECLNNVVKHAGATSVWVNFGGEDASISLSVEDDGVGFDCGASPDGIGLNGMRERFAMLDGDVRVESAPGRGTRLSGSVPVEPAPGPEALS